MLNCHRQPVLTGIIGTRPVLSLADDCIPTEPTLSKVVHLEVPAQLVKAETVEKVMVHVARIEQLGDRQVAARHEGDWVNRRNRRTATRVDSHVLLGTETLGLAILVVKDVRLVDRSSVVQPVTRAFPIPASAVSRDEPLNQLDLDVSRDSLLSKDVVPHGSGKRGPRAITSGRLVLARLGLIPPNPRSLQPRLLTRDRLPLVRVTSVRDRMPSSGGGDGIPRRVYRREVAYGRVVDAEREDAVRHHERESSVPEFRFAIGRQGIRQGGTHV